MDETAKHMTCSAKAYASILDSLDRLELSALSYVQLRRLHKILADASVSVDEESLRRSDDADDDNSGDTVRVASPTL